MRKILITGGTGFIGANLTHSLVGLGYKPTLLIRNQSNLWRLKTIKDKIKFIEGDLTDNKILEKLIIKTKPTHIFHMASYGSNQGKQNNISLTYYNNVIGTMNLFNICCQCGFEYFINTGSSSEYGIKKKSMKETDLLEPINYYGVTKAINTLTATMLSKKHQLPMVTLRLFSPYGCWEDKLRLIPHIIINALHNRPVNLSNPRFARDFIFISDVINAYLYFLNGEKYYGEVFNIGFGQQHTIGKIVEIVSNRLGKKLDVVWQTHLSNQLEPKKWLANIDKTGKMLKWKPKLDIEQGLVKSINWFKNNIISYI